MLSSCRNPADGRPESSFTSCLSVCEQSNIHNEIIQRSSSLPNFPRRWICKGCLLNNNSVITDCISCGANEMATPEIFVNDDEIQEKETNLNNILDNDCQEYPINKSPKRQSLSVYEKVKSKVSRSLSNGSVVHKKYTEPRRPSSLLVEKDVFGFENVDNNSNFGDGADCERGGDKQTWSCQRCTLYNSYESERCEVCETPRKSNLPVSTATPDSNKLTNSSVIIAFPEWNKCDLFKINGSHGQSPELWQKPVYRRSQSELLSNEVHHRSDISSCNVANRLSYTNPSESANNSKHCHRESVNNLNIQRSSSLNRPNFSKYVNDSGNSSRGLNANELISSDANGSSNAGSIIASCLNSPLNKLEHVDATGGDNAPASLDVLTATSNLERKWTCIKCSYAYNPFLSEKCDICSSIRTPPSLTEPSLITVTKNSVRYTSKKLENDSGNAASLNFPKKPDRDEKLVPFDCENKETEWTCRKCTLVNSSNSKVCVVCGGSKLKSVSLVCDMTLRKGEFWTCPQCTLRNPIGIHACQVCKAQNKTSSPLLLDVPNKNVPAPRSPSPRHGSSRPKHFQGVSGSGCSSAGQKQQKPVTRRHSSGATACRALARPKVSVTTSDAKTPSSSSSLDLAVDNALKSWQCIHCTFENRTASPACEMCHSARRSGPVSASPCGSSPCAGGGPNQDGGGSSKAQKSELTENLRITEEKEALSKWESIVNYCKEVSAFMEPFQLL